MRNTLAPIPTYKPVNNNNVALASYYGIISAMYMSAFSLGLFAPRTDNDWAKVISLTALIYVAKALYAAYLVKYTDITPSYKKDIPPFFAALTITTVLLLASSFDLSHTAPKMVSERLPHLLLAAAGFVQLVVHLSNAPPAPNERPTAAARPT